MREKKREGERERKRGKQIKGQKMSERTKRRVGERKEQTNRYNDVEVYGNSGAA